MLRSVAFACLMLAAVHAQAMQASGVLRIRVTIVDADQRTIPLARHALLVGDDPPTASPRRIVTTADGTIEIRLRPGRYLVESEEPSTVQGRAYRWSQAVDLAAGRSLTLELTPANAEAGPVAAEIQASPSRAEAPPAAPVVPHLAKWQGSVVALWTEHRHAAGFIVSGNGLVATSLSGLGNATSIEVQLSPTHKVSGRVLATDAAHDVAIVQINPAAAISAQSAPLGCGSAGAAGVMSMQDLLRMEVLFFGTTTLMIDFPFRTVPPSAVCAVVASAEQKLAGAAPPSAAHLPVEWLKPLPVETAPARGFSLSSYVGSSSDFDIMFITPVLLAVAKSQQGRTGAGNPLSGMRAVTNFGEWSDYVAESPPVLFIRASPKMVESFWMTLVRAVPGRGAIPPIRRVGPGFSRMRLLCGNTEIAPVHPFRIRARVSDTEDVDEGFYAFDAMAIGPQCGTVSLVLSSVKDPDKTETEVVPPAVVAQIWNDFAAYRPK